ncbi:hypothetical protein C1645_812100 [Glomus cerebriforme]|uniref:Uncharacterized protein n=1 Tax=Glomus cerebriforme TaxID=658196 RepID=A0A397TNB8_9GLOM|nr:hypothetical protein C1645_812100 [Glomus cerebriforme]
MTKDTFNKDTKSSSVSLSFGSDTLDITPVFKSQSVRILGVWVIISQKLKFKYMVESVGQDESVVSLDVELMPYLRYNDLDTKPEINSLCTLLYYSGYLTMVPGFLISHTHF